jgi:hypothetical protein
MRRVILLGEVGSQIEPSLTWEGLRNMLGDMRRLGQRMPSIIMVSEGERRDLNQEILGNSRDPVAKEDQRPEHDGECIGFLEGVMIRSHPDVPKGKARFIYPPVFEQAKPLPSGKVFSLGVG